MGDAVRIVADQRPAALQHHVPHRPRDTSTRRIASIRYARSNVSSMDRSARSTRAFSSTSTSRISAIRSHQPLSRDEVRIEALNRGAGERNGRDRNERRQCAPARRPRAAAHAASRAVRSSANRSRPASRTPVEPRLTANRAPDGHRRTAVSLPPSGGEARQVPADVAHDFGELREARRCVRADFSPCELAKQRSIFEHAVVVDVRRERSRADARTSGSRATPSV